MRCAPHIDCGGDGCEGCHWSGYVAIPDAWRFGALVMPVGATATDPTILITEATSTTAETRE